MGLWVRRDTAEMVEPKRECGACGGPLQVEEHADGGTIEIYNEAYLSLGGGYGSFTDDIVRHGPSGPYEFVLCEACAVKLCRALGLDEPLREHHTSTVCECPDRPDRDERGFPKPCRCEVCARRPDAPEAGALDLRP